jgi:hypothetical protein
VRVGGIVATGAGIHTMLAGARTLPGQRPSDNPVLDNELRYLGAFYSAHGVALLRAASEVETRPAAIRSLAAPVFLGGLARLVGWRSGAPPHPFQRLLLAIELTAPVAVAALQRAAADER